MKAKNFYEMALTTQKDSAKAHEKLGDVYQALGDLHQAKAEFEKASAIDKDNEELVDKIKEFTQ